MTFQASSPGLETEACDGYGWWNRDTHTHMCAHKASIIVRCDGYDWWKLWTPLPEPFTSFLAGLGQPTRVSLNSTWIGLQINRFPVRSDGCIHLLSWRSLLFTTKHWCCWGWMSFFRMDERPSMCGVSRRDKCFLLMHCRKESAYSYFCYQWLNGELQH